MEIIRKFMALAPIAIGYALLNGFYEQEAFDTGTHWTVVKKFDFLISPSNQEIKESNP